MKTILLTILTFILIISGCKDDSSVNTNTGLLYSADSLYHIKYDTLPYGIVPVEIPKAEGYTNTNLLLEFDGETNLDSINGVPYVYLYVKANSETALNFISYSKTEINKHHRYVINTGASVLKPVVKYALYIKVFVLESQVMGLKYVGLKNVKLSAY